MGKFPDSGTSDTLKVFAGDNHYQDHKIFNNEIATIKLTTDDDSVFDIFTITKLYDGVKGDSVISAILDNEDQWIPCDADGNPLHQNSDEPLAENELIDYIHATITIYEGSDDITNDWNITAEGTNAEGTLTDHTFSVTSVSANYSYVTFRCTHKKNKYSPITKTLSLTKIKKGTDGESPILYELKTNTLVVNRDEDGNLDKRSVTFTATSQQDGNT